MQPLTRYAALLLLLTGTSLAQEIPTPDPVVVTVSAEALPESVTSASVTVLTRSQIQESGALNVAELLRTSAGIQITRLGGVGGKSTASIRGSETNSVLVLLDGIPVNDLTDQTGGSFDLSRLGLDGVSQIEIVRGSMSSIYGSEAMAGVINIVTAPPALPDGKAVGILAEGGVGSFQSGDIRAAVSGQSGPLGYVLSGSHFQVGEQIESDKSSLNTVGLAGTLAAGERTQLRFTSRLMDGESRQFPANGGGPEYSILRDPAVDKTSDALLGATIEHQATSRTTLGFRVDYFERDLESSSPPILDGENPGPTSVPSSIGSSTFSRTRLNASGLWKPADRWTAHVLLQMRHETGDADFMLAGFIPSRFSDTRKTAAAAGELTFSDSRLTATAGLRADKTDSIDGQVSPRLGLTVPLGTSNHRLKANWGKGFRLPSFYALAEPNVGNPGLRPERTTAWDLSWEMSGLDGRTLVSATWYRSRYRDLVDFSPEVFRLINRDQVTGQGIELEAAAGLTPELRLQGHVAYLDLKLVGSSDVLRDRPKWRGGASLNWRPLSRLMIDLATVLVGPRYDFQLPVPGQDEVGGYSSADLYATWTLAPGWELYGRVDNFLDHRYHEFIGFPAPGISVRSGLRFRGNW